MGEGVLDAFDDAVGDFEVAVGVFSEVVAVERFHGEMIEDVWEKGNSRMGPCMVLGGQWEKSPVGISIDS